MSDKSAIEWTDASWNPVTGCSKVSPGCANCYAETISLRFGHSKKPWTPENAAENVVLHPDRLDQPLRWRRPRMVFVNSMSDLFHEQIPDDYIHRVWKTMIAAHQHVFQVLTKRPERARDWLRKYHALDEPGVLDDGPIENVWLGVSIENARHTWRADVLREIPATVRFISAEPLLGSLYDEKKKCPRCAGHGWEVEERVVTRVAAECCGRYVTNAYGEAIDCCNQPIPVPVPDVEYEQVACSAACWRGYRKMPLDLTGIDWLIVGGESGGRQARPMHPDWARELRDACLIECLDETKGSTAGIAEGYHPDTISRQHRRPAFFFKQWGSWAPCLPADKGAIAMEPSGSSRRAADALPSRETAWLRYVGASPKSGGRLLDGREWNEMPRQEVTAATS